MQSRLHSVVGRIDTNGAALLKHAGTPNLATTAPPRPTVAYNTQLSTSGQRHTLDRGKIVKKRTLQAYWEFVEPLLDGISVRRRAVLTEVVAEQFEPASPPK